MSDITPETIKKPAEELNNHINDLKELVKDLSSKVKDKSKIDELLEKVVLPETQQKDKLLDEILSSIDKSMENSDSLLDKDKEILASMKDKIINEIKIDLNGLQASITSPILGGRPDDFLERKEITQDMLNGKEGANPIMAFIMKFLHSFENNSLVKTFFNLGFDMSKKVKILIFFEKNGYGEKDLIQGVLAKIKDINYKNFDDLLKDKGSKGTLDYLEELWKKPGNLVKDLFGSSVSFTEKEKPFVQKLIELISVNKELIDKELGNDKDGAKMNDVFKTVFPNNLSDNFREESMPAKGIKYNVYKK